MAGMGSWSCVLVLLTLWILKMVEIFFNTTSLCKRNAPLPAALDWSCNTARLSIYWMDVVLEPRPDVACVAQGSARLRPVHVRPHQVGGRGSQFVAALPRLLLVAQTGNVGDITQDENMIDIDSYSDFGKWRRPILWLCAIFRGSEDTRRRRRDTWVGLT